MAHTRRSEAEGSTEAATDELSALAARADRLRAAGAVEDSETATGATPATTDLMAQAAAAIEAGNLAGAAVLVSAAAHRPGADPAVLATLSERLSMALEGNAKQLADARNCSALDELAGRLRSADFAPPAGLTLGLESCKKDSRSPADAGPDAIPSQLQKP